MSDEVILETVKAELDAADAATLKSIWQNLREARQKVRISPDVPQKKTLQFMGENHPFDSNRQLSIKERAANKLRLRNQNRAWLLQKFKTLRAAWFMVINGKITASGKTLSDYPTPEQLLEVCHRTGKFPLLFINEKVTAIEESASAWHTTIEPEDFYPTVPVKFRSDEVETAVIGDLDTGAISTFVDYDLEVFLKFQPCLLLNFEKGQTEIWNSAMISRVRPKTKKKKKRAQRPRQ